MRNKLMFCTMLLCAAFGCDTTVLKQDTEKTTGAGSVTGHPGTGGVGGTGGAGGICDRTLFSSPACQDMTLTEASASLAGVSIAAYAFCGFGALPACVPAGIVLETASLPLLLNETFSALAPKDDRFKGVSYDFDVSLLRVCPAEICSVPVPGVPRYLIAPVRFVHRNTKPKVTAVSSQLLADGRLRFVAMAEDFEEAPDKLECYWRWSATPGLVTWTVLPRCTLDYEVPLPTTTGTYTMTVYAKDHGSHAYVFPRPGFPEYTDVRLYPDTATESNMYSVNVGVIVKPPSGGTGGASGSGGGTGTGGMTMTATGGTSGTGGVGTGGMNVGTGGRSTGTGGTGTGGNGTGGNIPASGGSGTGGMTMVGSGGSVGTGGMVVNGSGGMNMGTGGMIGTGGAMVNMCTSGLCCDPMTSTVRPSGTSVGVQELGYPWGMDCGADVGIHSRYCTCNGISPESNQCGEWGSWSTNTTCNSMTKPNAQTGRCDPVPECGGSGTGGASGGTCMPWLTNVNSWLGADSLTDTICSVNSSQPMYRATLVSPSANCIGTPQVLAGVIIGSNGDYGLPVSYNSTDGTLIVPVYKNSPYQYAYPFASGQTVQLRIQIMYQGQTVWLDAWSNTAGDNLCRP